MTAAELAQRAREAAVRAYAPYSGFRVGSVVVADDGTTYAGVNVENAAYGSTICAESTAIAHAVSSGARRLTTVAVACIDAESVEDAYPCGQCRQQMTEFGVETVLVTAGSGEVRQHALAELLPHGFRME
jgi:cytidine deaminase